jgi:Helicase associated domain
VVRQRRHCEKLREGKPSHLTAQKLAQLAELGFQFTTSHRLTFEERIQQWVEYREKNGCEPKRLSPDGLGKWVCQVRQKHLLLKEGKPTNLSQEQVDRLTELGFKWSSGQKRPERNGAPNKSWDARLEDLYAYKAEHGDTSVPQHYPELGNWVHKQVGCAVYS